MISFFLVVFCVTVIYHEPLVLPATAADAGFLVLALVVHARLFFVMFALLSFLFFVFFCHG